MTQPTLFDHLDTVQRALTIRRRVERRRLERAAKVVLEDPARGDLLSPPTGVDRAIVAGPGDSMIRWLLAKLFVVPETVVESKRRAWK